MIAFGINFRPILMVLSRNEVAHCTAYIIIEFGRRVVVGHSEVFCYVIPVIDPKMTAIVNGVFHSLKCLLSQF